MTFTQQAIAPGSDILVSRFSRLAPLNEHERGLLRLIEGRVIHHRVADAKLLVQGTEISTPHFILSGWACRIRELANGRRQIIGILLPGDAIGLSAGVHPRSPTDVVALTPMRTVKAPEIVAAWRERERAPGLSAALDLAAAEEEHFLVHHIVRLGRQTAYERIAHWFMELDYRLSSRGLSASGVFPLPMTQEDIGNAVGLSVVHVNRTLQQMRREGRIHLTHRQLSLLDRQALRTAGEFEPPSFFSAGRGPADGRSADAMAD